MITNNAKQITLPEDLKNAIEKVRVQLAIQQNELSVIQKARFSEQGSVESLIKNRQFLTEKIEELGTEMTDKMNSLDNVNAVLENKQTEFTELMARVDEAKEKLNEAEVNKVRVDALVLKSEQDIERRLAEISLKEAEIKEKETEADKRLAEFKNFMKQYDSLE
jgi:chromosome segregation ATPase